MTTPFVLVVDQVSAEALHHMDNAALAEKVGARAVLCFAESVDLE